MGDNGHMYVDNDLLPAYKDHIIPLATVLTPNQYEAELLTGTRIDSKASALAACKTLHNRGIATVVRFFIAATTCFTCLIQTVLPVCQPVNIMLHALNVCCLP